MNALPKIARHCAAQAASVAHVHPSRDRSILGIGLRFVRASSSTPISDEPLSSVGQKNRYVYSSDLPLRKSYNQSFHNQSPSHSPSNQDLNRLLARPLLLDTLKLVRKFEDAGLPTHQAEALTNLIAELMANTSERMADTFISKAEAEQVSLRNDAAVQMFRHEFSQSHENEMAKLQRDIERQKVEIDKLKAELRYEVDKVTSGHRLDLNLERGRIRDELGLQETRAHETALRLDKEINTLRTNIEAGKNDLIKYCVGTIVGTASICLAVVRLLM